MQENCGFGLRSLSGFGCRMTDEACRWVIQQTDRYWDFIDDIGSTEYQRFTRYEWFIYHTDEVGHLKVSLQKPSGMGGLVNCGWGPAGLRAEWVWCKTSSRYLVFVLCFWIFINIHSHNPWRAGYRRLVLAGMYEFYICLCMIFITVIPGSLLLSGGVSTWKHNSKNVIVCSRVARFSVECLFVRFSKCQTFVKLHLLMWTKKSVWQVNFAGILWCHVTYKTFWGSSKKGQ